jgi:hypothetical protein
LQTMKTNGERSLNSYKPNLAIKRTGAKGRASLNLNVRFT